MSWLGIVDGGRGEYARNGLNTLPAARVVAVYVFLASGEIIDRGALHVHGERPLGVIRDTTSPFDGPWLVLSGVSTGPDSETDSHGCLGIIVASIRGSIRERPDQRAINIPFQLFRSPMGGVIVEVISRIGRDGVVDGTVIGREVAFAEVIGFYICSIAADKFPVHLVEIVGLEHNGRDDALAGCRAHYDGYRAEEDVELGLNSGGVAFLGDGKLGSIVAIVEGASGDIESLVDSSRGVEVESVIETESRVRRAGQGRIHRIAGRPCLGEDWCEQN